MEKKNITLKTALTINLLIVVFEIIGAVISWQNFGFGLFQFYTQDSNLIALVASAVLAYYQIRKLCTNNEIPLWALKFKYTAVCGLSITFLIVLFILIPGDGWDFQLMLFSESMLYHHLLCPILAFSGFIFLEIGSVLKRKDLSLVMIPTAIYAVVLLILNFTKVLTGPYFFLMVYDNPIWMTCMWILIIPSVMILISYGIYRLYMRKSKE